MSLSHAERAFRPDLNGLRAVAVVSVLLFHFKIRPFGGGFVGVDVFFVISGFLMTQIIAGGLETGRFNVLRFYLNRLARIVPALVAVAAACLIVAGLVLPPEQFAQLSNEALNAVTFRVNYFYAGDTGYFAPSAAQRWFLHCWSLAVEFQFYVVFPLLLMFAHKLSRRYGPVTLLLLIALASAMWSYLQTGSNPVAAFYLLPARAWEFALGGLVLYLPEPAHAVRKTLAATGLALIMAASIFLNEQLIYPSWLAGVPVMGAVILILARSNFGALTNIVAQYLGTVSYSLYLWHWPILTISHFFGLGDSSLQTAVLVLLTFVMAHFSNRLIETPFRDAFRRLTINRTVPLTLAILSLVGACLTINASAGLPERMQQSTAELLQRSNYHGQFRDGTCFLRPEQSFSEFAKECFEPSPGSAKPKMVI